MKETYTIYQDRMIGGVRVLTVYATRYTLSDAIHLVNTMSPDPYRDGWFILETPRT